MAGDRKALSAPQGDDSLESPRVKFNVNILTCTAVFYLEQVHFLTRVYKLCNRAFREYLGEKEMKDCSAALSRLDLLSPIPPLHSVR
jgi:hypothetical protein